MPTAVQNTNAAPRALSMWQPWASLLAHGIKKVESRGRDTPFRGEFYIHATGSVPKVSYTEHYLKDPEFLMYVNHFLRVGHYNPISWNDYRHAFPTGQLIGKARITDSMPSWDLKEKWGPRRMDDWQREFTLGDHGSDRFAWMVEQPQVISIGAITEKPMGIPAKGSQSLFWKIPPAIIDRPIAYITYPTDYPYVR